MSLMEQDVVSQLTVQLPSRQEGSDTLATYMQSVRQMLPVVERTLTDYGEAPVSDYLQAVSQTVEQRYQPHDDLAEAVYESALSLFGEETALQVKTELQQSPVVLTANHHGVDYFAQSVQGTLFFSQRVIADGQRARTVPVLACGSIPLDNLTYPRGALVYAAGDTVSGRYPQKLPLFPDRLKRKMVSEVSSLDQAMLQRAVKAVAKRRAEGSFAVPVADVLKQLLEQDYADAGAEVADYSRQASLVNARIWDSMLADVTDKPALVYLELEKVVARLLIKDLQNPQSLLYPLLFEPQLQAEFLTRLDGVKGCWSCEELRQRLEQAGESGHQQRAAGSFMFWGVGNKGQKIALLPVTDAEGCWLRGVDDKGTVWQLEFTAESLTAALDDGRILPSVMACFIALPFARGVTCAGGYYQGDYLALMQQRLLHTLTAVSGFEAAASAVAKAPVDSYLSGMQAVMLATEQGLIPAGPLEILAAGGLSDTDMDVLRHLSVTHAHQASLFETLGDVAADMTCEVGFETSVSLAIQSNLAENLIVKSIR